MANNAEQKLTDSSEVFELDVPLLVQAGRMAFVFRRAGRSVHISEDYYKNEERLADVWPAGRKNYSSLVRGIVVGGLVLSPREELVIGRTVGLEIHDADSAIDSVRSSLHFDHALRLAFETDTSMSSRHVAIMALQGAKVHVMDLGSTNGTFIQRLE